MESVIGKVPRAKYTVVGETLRQVIPGHMQCSMGCGGRACKYEDPTRWRDDEQAIKGLYSSWITENLLAMARPSTEIIEKYNIIDQFQRCGLKTVINLQSPGEHASCGNPLEPESGFTYRPETFMEAGVYFYNFGWKDYGVASLTTILDMVKVMSFALQEGKMAIHCHAGLGRTGVLLACYLVFTTRMTADQAILFVRAKRPNSIQTRGQLLCVREFAQFLLPLRNVFTCAEPRANAVTLAQFLNRQQHLLHGYEARQLKYIPKLVQVVCKLLLDIAENRQVIEEEILEIPDLTAEVERTVSHQAMKELDREMIGKGIPCLPGPLVEPKQTSELYIRKSLSYSDSDLSRLQFELKLLGSRLCELTQATSQSSIGETSTPCSPATAEVCRKHSFYDSTNSVWEQTKLRNQKDGHCLLQKRRLLKDTKRSKSLGSPYKNRKQNNGSKWERSGRKPSVCNKQGFCMAGDEEEKDRSSEVPFITIQTELTLENRRVLVAQALAVDLEQEGEEEYSQEVSRWQKELNSKEGAWERLCSEQDPFILSGLLWSWLEQLKEPIISKNNVQRWEENNQKPQSVLDSLDKGAKQTLTCILDCFANLLNIPENVESAFLNRTIKAFSKMRMDSEDGKLLYNPMRTILAPVLHEMRMKAIEERLSLSAQQVR
ncbi:protein tyrosine phosphatase domain-containing protein 1 [Scleropages formosus]|uniref:protein tyrosine phosphatase domain-containing protein 1 n=1 Tax=Scleropages formosus TaxID=113540 RepID=UPI0010FAC883|nr:protein tyrosine phosphatase domain-containing protein 1-like [Scleropages formosus]